MTNRSIGSKVALGYTLKQLYAMTQHQLTVLCDEYNVSTAGNPGKHLLLVRIMAHCDVLKPDEVVSVRPTERSEVVSVAANSPVSTPTPNGKPQKQKQHKPSRVLRGGIGSEPIVITPASPAAFVRVERNEQTGKPEAVTPKPASKPAPKEPMPDSYKAVMTLGNEKLDALAKRLGVDNSECFTYAQRAANVWAKIGGNKRHISPQEPTPAKTEQKVERAIAPTPTVVVVDEVKAATYKAVAGMLNGVLSSLRAIGHTESNGDMGTVVADLERIRDVIGNRGKATPVELMPSSTAAVRPAPKQTTTVAPKPAIETRSPDDMRVGPGYLCRVCRKVKTPFDSVGMCRGCALSVAGIQDKEIRKIESPNVFTPVIDEDGDEDGDSGIDVREVEKLLAKGTIGSLKTACKMIERDDLTSKGHAAMKNAVSQWLSNNTSEDDDTIANDCDEETERLGDCTDDDVISPAERKAMRDADEEDSDDEEGMTADDYEEANADEDKPFVFRTGNRVEVVADENPKSTKGHGELIGKTGTVRSVQYRKGYTLVKVTLDGERKACEFTPSELSHTDAKLVKVSEQFGSHRDRDLAWCAKKVQIIEYLRRCNAVSPTTAVSFKAIGEKTGLSKRDVRHFIYHAAALKNVDGTARDEGYVSFAKDSESKGQMAWLTKTGRRVNTRTELSKEIDRRLGR